MSLSLVTVLCFTRIIAVTLFMSYRSASAELEPLQVSSSRNTWSLDPEIDPDIRDALMAGLKDAISIAAVVLDPENGIDNSVDNDKYLKAYFGDDGDKMYDKVRHVTKNLMANTLDGTKSDILGTVMVYNDDWWIPEPDEIPGIPNDGKKHACELGKDGLTMTAYTKPLPNPEMSTNWGMHFCPKWNNRVRDGYSLSRLMADDCAILRVKGVMDTDLMNRQNYAYAILHELFHVDEVAHSVTGMKIKDYAYGAWDVLELARRKEDVATEPLENADSFAWYAVVSHLFLFTGNFVCGPLDASIDLLNSLPPVNRPLREAFAKAAFISVR